MNNDLKYDDDLDEFCFYVNPVYKNGNQIGQIFSTPGMIDIFYIDE